MPTAGPEIDRRVDNATRANRESDKLLVCFQTIESYGIMIPVPLHRPKGDIDGCAALLRRFNLDRTHPLQPNFIRYP